MVRGASILIADDEETFREPTRRLLCRAGFDCHGVRDGNEAIERLQRRSFDLLIADIRMPRNPDLQLIREAQELDSHMPVILVTGYPSTETAIRCLEMPVVAYLTKPLDVDELMTRVRTSIEHCRRRRLLSVVQQLLRSCLMDLDAVESKCLTRQDTSGELVSMSTVRMLATCLSGLLELVARYGAGRNVQNLCELLDCPQKPIHRWAIAETIEVLKETRNTFKSKALADLRTRLEALLGSGQGLCCHNDRVP